ncbi:MAG: FHA domain-containing protein, partial [Actinobacteria bacterium]|nr:FHA domain-containing protein [Actinomycetota bacterium]
MKLLVEWLSNSVILEPERSYTIGRDPNCDIPINDSRISRTHIRISFNGKTWELADLGSSNGTFRDSKQVDRIKVNETVDIHLGGVGNLLLTFTVLQGSTGERLKPTMRVLDKDATRVAKNINEESISVGGPRRIRLQQRIRIGRGEESDWRIDDLNVSRSHAEVVQNKDGSYEMIDLKSTNGTFINGQSIKREKLIYGDVISIVGHKRKFTSD